MANDCIPGVAAKYPNLTCLGRGERIGLFVRVQFCVIPGRIEAATLSPLSSLFAVSWLFSRIILNVYRKSKTDRLIRRPMEVYLLSLFASEFVESLASSFNLNWIIHGRLWSGAYCDAQGFVVTVGETAVALITITIAVHTFILLWPGVNREFQSIPVAWTIMGICWTFDIICSLVLFTTKPEFYAPTPFWCWVNARKYEYLSYKLLVFYAWLWLAMFVSFLGYLPLFFFFRKRQAYQYSFYMICYPLVYCVLGLPLSGARWAQFTLPKRGVPPAATLSTSFIFDLSGLGNVLLFMYTRQGLLLFPKKKTPSDVLEEAKPSENSMTDSDRHRSVTDSDRLGSVADSDRLGSVADSDSLGSVTDSDRLESD